MPVKPGQHDVINQQQLLLYPQERSKVQKRWLKRYRTEVAASVSSICSTFCAVSSNDLVLGFVLSDLVLVSIGFGENTNADIQIQ